MRGGSFLAARSPIRRAIFPVGRIAARREIGIQIIVGHDRLAFAQGVGKLPAVDEALDELPDLVGLKRAEATCRPTEVSKRAWRLRAMLSRPCPSDLGEGVT